MMAAKKMIAHQPELFQADIMTEKPQKYLGSVNSGTLLRPNDVRTSCTTPSSVENSAFAIPRQTTVRINVRDNGIGIPTEELERIRQSLEKDDRPVESCAASNGFALRNVHRRLRYFYGDPYGVHIESIEGLGTSVTIIIAREERGRSC